MEKLLKILNDLNERFYLSRHHRPIVANLTSQALLILPETLEQALAAKVQLPLDVWVALHPLGRAAGLEVVSVTVADGEYGWALNGYLAKHSQSYGLNALGSAFSIQPRITAQLQVGGDDEPMLGDITTAVLCLQDHIISV